MVFTIAQKELYTNLVSARFIIGFLLCLFLIPFSLFVSIDDYEDHLRAYAIDKEQAEESNRVRVYSALRPEIVKPSEPLSIFSRGILHNVGNKVKILLSEKPLLAYGQQTANDNPLMNSFLSIDFISIIAIVLSLLALLFTYDSCTREKEEGTLRLQLSNSIGRSKILLGKILGVYLTFLPIILFCFLSSALVILLSPHILLSSGEWSRVAVIFIFILLYLSLFMFLGLLISAHFHSSKASVNICLILWVFLVFLIPNLAIHLLESFVSVPKEESLRFVLNDIDREFWKNYEEFRRTHQQPEGGHGYQYSDSDGVMEVTGSSLEMMEYTRNEMAFSEPLRIEFAEKKWPLQKAYINKLERQRDIAEMISLVSPSQLFRLVCSHVCRTDAAAYLNFLEKARLYRDEFIRFYRDNKIFSSFSYFTPQSPETFLVYEDSERKRARGEEIASPPSSYPYLDVSNVPKFQWKTSNVLVDIEKVLVKVTTLVLLSIVLFYLSFLSFLRYDVR